MTAKGATRPNTATARSAPRPRGRTTVARRPKEYRYWTEGMSARNDERCPICEQPPSVHERLGPVLLACPGTTTEVEQENGYG